MKKYLYQVCHEFGISLNKKQLEQFQIYYDYLLQMNQVMNLTAITEEREVVIKHFLDSIAIMKYYSFEQVSSIIDMGTGAGFPGIPLAIMMPEVSFTLMDSLGKRIKFLHQVCKMCDLPNVTCIHSRAEELGRDKNHREQYDVCVSRAVANLSVLLEYCIPFVKKGGTFISYKSIQGEEELQESQNAQNKLCCKMIKKITFYLGQQYSEPLFLKSKSRDSKNSEKISLNNQEYSRNFLIFEKFDIVSNKYPRQNGLPKKKPL